MANDIKLCVRIDSKTNDRLSDIMNSTGFNKSQVVKMLFDENMDVLIIKDGSRIAEELFRIEKLLREKAMDEEIRSKILHACDDLTSEIYNLFKENDKDGGNESDKC